MRRRFRFTLLTLLLVALLGTGVQARKWRSADGRQEVEADFVSFKNGKVRLKKANGRFTTVPIEKLSEQDQQYVRRRVGTDKPMPDDDSDDVPKIKPPTNTELVQSVEAKWSNTIRVGDDNKPLPPNLEVNVELIGEAALGAIAFGRLSLEPVETDTGEKLTPAKPFGVSDIRKEYARVDRKRSFGREHPDKGLNIPIEFEAPGETVKRIKRLKGTIKLKTSDRRDDVIVEKITTKSGGQLDEKSFAEAGLKNVKVNIRGGKQFSVQFEGQTEKVIGVELLDGKGKTIESSGHGSFSFGSTRGLNLDFDNELPADAKLKITLAVHLKEITVPLEFNDIEVPARN